MFKSSGKKIKSVASIVFVFWVIVAVIILIGALIVANENRYGGGVFLFYGVIISAVICLYAWLNSLFMSAFGDLVNSNERIEELLELNLTEDNKNVNQMKQESTQMNTYIITYEEGGNMSKMEMDFPINYEYEDIEKKVKKDKHIFNILSIQEKN